MDGPIAVAKKLPIKEPIAKDENKIPAISFS